MATGIQRPGQNTFFDVAVLDTGAESYLGKKALTVLRDKEQRKTAKYEERAQMLGGTFVPLVCSVFGTLAPESAKMLSHIVGELKEEQPEKRCTTKMQRVALQVAILKATSLCLRARSVTSLPEAPEPQGYEDCRVAHADARPALDDGPLPPRGPASPVMVA